MGAIEIATGYAAVKLTVQGNIFQLNYYVTPTIAESARSYGCALSLIFKMACNYSGTQKTFICLKLTMQKKANNINGQA